ncbi:MAG: hypothetical protein ACXVDI_26125, partial [Ktedonobacterales bacterium]
MRAWLPHNRPAILMTGFRGDDNDSDGGSAVNRVAVWILGTVSGILLVFGAMIVSAHGGYGASSSCATYGPSLQPCTPTLQYITLLNPLGGGALSSAGLMLLLLAILIGLPAWIASPILAQRRGSSARTAILIVSIIASAFVIVSLVVPSLSSPALSTPATCLGSGGAGQPCVYGGPAKVVALLGIGFAPLLASLLMGMPAWVMALTETTRRKRWGWFVAVLFFSPIAAMLYGFFGIQSHASEAPPAPTLAASGA